MEQYKTLIDDWEEFRESVQTPALSTVRKNHLKASDDFKERLRARFEEVEQAGWNPDIYRLRGEKLPGKSMLHWFGEYYVQEESATIPVEILNPQQGDKILDMCAAPGGKTTQIASKIRNRGVIVANDESSKRLQSLHANVYRTGAASVAVTNYDGRHIPEDEKYDRILLDAPCSGEGDRARRTFEAADEQEKESLSDLQKQLGEKAAKMLEDNGIMVYSTCTINPQENEEVVKHLVENTELELEKIELETDHVSGVTEFEGAEYGEEMKKTVRIYPHHFGSGVIYIARFRN
jgi:NOL1/NOP2/sun family putative RNA methylase